MKLFIICGMLLLYNATCKSIKPDAVIFEYSETSRKQNKLIRVTQKSITIQDNNIATSVTKPIQTAQWAQLIAILKQTNAKSIPTLKAPSNRFLFDGAALAKLKLIVNDSTYISPPFDKGNPPTEIHELVNTLISISKTIE